jgi:hypothetical protein
MYILKEDVGTFKNAKGEEKTKWRTLGRMVKHVNGKTEGFSIYLDELPNKVDGVDSNGVKLSSSAFHSFSAFEVVEKAEAETVVNQTAVPAAMLTPAQLEQAAAIMAATQNA